MSLRIRTYADLEGGDADLAEQVARQEERVAGRLASIDRVVGVMSGKGGVGKSLLTAVLGAALARRGRSVAILDADLHGPSIARMLGVREAPVRVGSDAVRPAMAGDVAVMSMSLLVQPDAALAWREPEAAGFVWRGAQERGALREFLADVAWGEREVLLVDLPPGTGRLVDLHELVPDLAGVLGVTIPSGAARDAVARSLELCRRRGIPRLGLVENMAGVRCAGCGTITPLYRGDAGAELSSRFEVSLAARVPFDPDLAAAAEDGGLDAWLAGESSTAALLRELADELLRAPEEEAGGAG